MKTGSGECRGRSVLDGNGLLLRWQEGRLTHVERIPVNEGPWIAPTLCDLQVNGFGGVDFQSDLLSETSLLQAASALQKFGCTEWLFTLITDRWAIMLERLDRAKKIRDANAWLRQRIIGWHLEGPFLSDEPGFCGAHRPGLMENPALHHLKSLKAVTGDDTVLLTLSPERPGSPEFIREARKAGFLVSLGHTNASAACLEESVSAGASAFTHLGNGCPQQWDRHDNIFWRVLDRNDLAITLIPDSIHVSPALFRLLHKAIPENQLLYVSDATAAAGAPPGKYQLGPLEVEVGLDRVVRQPGKTNFAGSALEPLHGIFKASAMLGLPWPAVWKFFSDHPRAFLGLPGSYQLGSPADFCLLSINQENNPLRVQTYVNGLADAGSEARIFHEQR